MHPARAILGVYLHSRPQLGLMQVEIIYSSDAQNALSWKGCADTIHERAADITEVVCHGMTRGDGALHAERLEVVTPSHML